MSAAIRVVRNVRRIAVYEKRPTRRAKDEVRCTTIEEIPYAR